jgi:hypothetical protein
LNIKGTVSFKMRENDDTNFKKTVEGVKINLENKGIKIKTPIISVNKKK